MGLLFHNAQMPSLFSNREKGWLYVKKEQISNFGNDAPHLFQSNEIQVIDCQGCIILPGLIDIHVHGGMGYEAMDASPEGLGEMSRYFARHGVTTFLAATWTASTDTISNVLDCIKNCMATQGQGATLAGAYLEGPYINPNRAGAQPIRFVRKAERGEALSFLDANVVKIAAFAPEIPGNTWLIEECIERGIVPAIGHSDATFEQVQDAVRRGARLVTHCFNGMSPFHQRAPGLIGAALTCPGLICELVADRVHVHPGAIKVLEACKGLEGIILITDAIRGSGAPDGEFQLEEKRILMKDGIARTEEGSLAGSLLTLEKDLMNFMEIVGKPLEEAWVVSSRNAANLLGLSNHTGNLDVGMDADIVVLDENYDVMMTVVKGKIVHTSPKFL